MSTLGGNGGRLDRDREIYKSIYGKKIYILYNMGGGNLEILHIYGAKAIFLLFCYHQDTEYE